MKTFYNRTVRSLAAAVFFISMFIPSAVSAHETTEIAVASTTQTTQSTAATDSYQFTAKKGDSLTRMARRALQLYQEDKKITLTSPAAVYGETVIAQALGGSYLEIGQHVNIPMSLLQSAVDGSKTLTSAQLKRWEQYAANVSFNVNDIQPEASPTTTTQSEGAKTDETKTESGDQAKTDQPDTKTTTDKKSAGTYWWFIGAGALIAVYFVLGGQTPRPRRQ